MMNRRIDAAIPSSSFVSNLEMATSRKLFPAQNVVYTTLAELPLSSGTKASAWSCAVQRLLHGHTSLGRKPAAKPTGSSCVDNPIQHDEWTHRNRTIYSGVTQAKYAIVTSIRASEQFSSVFTSWIVSFSISSDDPLRIHRCALRPRIERGLNSLRFGR